MPRFRLPNTAAEWRDFARDAILAMLALGSVLGFKGGTPAGRLDAAEKQLVVLRSDMDDRAASLRAALSHETRGRLASDSAHRARDSAMSATTAESIALLQALVRVRCAELTRPDIARLGLPCDDVKLRAPGAR